MGSGNIRKSSLEDSLIKRDTDSLLTESSPLLKDHEVKQSCLAKYFPRGFKTEFKSVFKLAWPMIYIQFFQVLLGPVSLAFAGRLSKLEYDSAALAISLVAITVISTATGLATACDTLFSQTVGNDQKNKLGEGLQRSLCILTLCALPVLAVHINATSILITLGQDTEVAVGAEWMLTLFIPGSISFFIYISFAKFLQTQNIVIPNVVIISIVNVTNFILSYILVIAYDYRLTGVAVAQCLSYILLLILTVSYILVFKVYEGCWEGFTIRCLLGWGQFGMLAIFGFLQVCVELWTFEAMQIVAGVLGTTELGAQTTVYQFESLWYQFSFGTGIACCILTGQHLGAREPYLARAAAWTGLLSLNALAIVVAILEIVLRNYLPLIFTTVPEVVEMSASLMPVLGFFAIADVWAGVGTGILRGMGRQAVGSTVVTVCFIIALAVAMPILFTTDIGLIVIWLSLLFLAIIPEGIIVAILLFKTDWEKEVDKAIANVEAKPSIDRNEDLLGSMSLSSRSSFRGSSRRVLNEDVNEEVTWKIIFYRIAFVTIMVGILVVAIILRILLPTVTMVDALEEMMNTTSVTNSSQMQTTEMFNVTELTTVFT